MSNEENVKKEEVKEEVEKKEEKIEEKASNKEAEQGAKPKEGIIPVKGVSVYYDSSAVEEIDKFSKLLIWGSKDRRHLKPMIDEIKNNKEKLAKAFSEILQPELYDKIINLFSSFGIELSVGDIKPRPPDPEPDTNASIEALTDFFNQASNVENKEVAIEKIKKFYGMTREQRIDYLSKVIDAIVKVYNRDGPVSAFYQFVNWITDQKGDTAYEGMVAYLYMARPQYQEVWYRFIASLFTFIAKSIEMFNIS